MPTSHQFGGSWTEEKLDRISSYLTAYRTIFSRNPRAMYYRTIYVDAFAGTGYRDDPQFGSLQGQFFPDVGDSDTAGFLRGSAYRALEVEPPFDQYIFIEKNPTRAAGLELLRAEFPGKTDRITIAQQEANVYLKHWCAQVDWSRWRAVVFLDPYGMQVEWSVIEAIAKTQAIDLWILFPLGVAVNRLLKREELPPPEWASALNRLFGTDDWQCEFYRPYTDRTLFGDLERQRKEASFDSIGRYFVERLKTIFPGVAEQPLPLRNSKGVPLYLLCFASGNIRGAPTAIRIAQYLLMLKE